ncbi:glyoxalase domain-containing protein 4 [Echinops telfairi]|uniref:Glyoxalase domain-containing protein 4 n=1 Tax=Echinops telfairi TaxID=9371 RepID=A0AC59C6Z3_ECHTE|nr:glyoxalase domain-containing protein 4 [Echinops telfairi]
MAVRRALHFVFKVGNRFQTAHFYRDVLGMKVLRHEEFEEGCKASSGGDLRATVVHCGEGSEGTAGTSSSYIDVEGKRQLANRVSETSIVGSHCGKLRLSGAGITLASSQAVDNARNMEWPLRETAEGVFETEAPGGYKFYLQNCSPPRSDPVIKVTLAVSDLQKSLNYWSYLLGMKIYEKDEQKQRALLGYADNQCKLELQGVEGAVEHAAAFGRMAFSCPQHELPVLEALMKRESQKILTPLVSLDTPGKATVQVVILADPVSIPQSECTGDSLCLLINLAISAALKAMSLPFVSHAMAADKSDEWFAQHNKPKASG